MDLKFSEELISKAILDFKPKAIVMMFSGGDDSLMAYHVAKRLGVKIDFVLHGNTRTGISETTGFACNVVENFGDKLLLADAGKSYEEYVMRKGFFGKGEKAHGYSYHILKANHFNRVISANIRQGQRDFPILFLNGARRLESGRRMKTMLNPLKRDPSQKNNIWVNIINEVDNHEVKEYLEGESIVRNSVSVNLCRSGECMCGTMQTKGDRIEAGYFYPEWKKWIDSLEKEVLKKFPWGWDDNINKAHHMEMQGQTNMFQPMCTGCKINYKESI